MSKEGNSIADVKATNNIRVDQFTKDLLITETNLFLKSMMWCSMFHRTVRSQGEMFDRVIRNGNHVMAIRFAVTRCGPTMSLKYTV